MSQVIQPVNGDPFIGMLETPVTSSPLVASYLSNLPAYRCVHGGCTAAVAAGPASKPASLRIITLLHCSRLAGWP